jgi:hypothetical protein
MLRGNRGQRGLTAAAGFAVRALIVELSQMPYLWSRQSQGCGFSAAKVERAR